MPAWRKAIVSVIGIAAFVAIYEVTILDSRYASSESAATKGKPTPGSRHKFTATAYCKGQTTASGVAAQNGAVAADPDYLPVGSVIELDTPVNEHDGVYTILDTGPKVQGKLLDIYMWSCHDALRFGRREVNVTVLRLGWNPQATAPNRSLIDRLFRRATPPPSTEPTQQPSGPGTTKEGEGGNPEKTDAPDKE